MNIKLNYKEIPVEVVVAKNILNRLLGLMFKNNLSENKCLILSPCNSIHTCFMKFNIDVFFVDKNLFIIKIIRNISPWKFTWIYFSAKHVIETSALNPHLINAKVGDHLGVDELC